MLNDPVTFILGLLVLGYGAFKIGELLVDLIFGAVCASSAALFNRAVRLIDVGPAYD
jgi:hypothetical protein